MSTEIDIIADPYPLVDLAPADGVPDAWSAFARDTESAGSSWRTPTTQPLVDDCL
jgi:hypothetical protein